MLKRLIASLLATITALGLVVALPQVAQAQGERPAPPRGAEITGGTPTTLDLIWFNDDVAFDGTYNIYNNLTSELLATTSEKSITLTGLQSDSYYEFYVKAQGALESWRSNIAKSRTAPAVGERPPPPNNFKVVGIGQTTVDLFWDSRAFIEGYNVYSTETQEIVATVTTNEATITGLTPNTAYSFFVKSFVGGAESWRSNFAGAVTGSVGVRPPAPQGLEVRAKTSTTADLTWISSVPELSFNIYNADTRELVATSSDLSVTVTGLQPGTQYSFFVKAAGQLESWRSNIARTTTTSASTRPLPPTGLYVTGKSFDSVNLAWSSAPAASYNIYNADTRELIATSTTRSVVIEDLQLGTTYRFFVKSTNGGLESWRSNIVAVMPG